MRLYAYVLVGAFCCTAFYSVWIVAGEGAATLNDRKGVVPDNGVLEQLAELLDGGRPQDALELIYSLPEPQQKHESVRLGLGRSKVQLGEKAEGEKILLQCAADDPESLEPALLLTRLYVTNQRWDEAKARATAAVAKHPTSSQALTLLAKVHVGRDDDIGTARLYLERALGLAADDPKVLFEYAMLLFLFDDEDSHLLAKKTFDRLERIDQSIADRKLVAKVYLHYRHQDWTRLELMKMHPSRMDAESMLLLADCCDAAGDVAEATEWYERVLRQDPYNALAHGALGLMMLGCGSRNYGAVHACGLNQETALRHLQVALQLEPASSGSGRLKPVEEAVVFCQKEIQEVKSWRQVVSGNVTSTASATTADTSNDATAPAVTVGTSIARDLLAPVAAAKKIAALLRRAARMLLVKLGLCEAVQYIPYLEVICRDDSMGSSASNSDRSSSVRSRVADDAGGSSAEQRASDMKKVCTALHATSTERH